MKNNTFIVIQREFMTRVSKKSFVILTILMPFIFAALIVVPLWLSSIKDDAQRTVVVVDRTSHYLAAFKDDKSYRFVPAPAMLPEHRSDTTEVEAVVNIEADLTQNPKAVKIYSRGEVAADLLSYVTNVLNEQVRRDKLQAYGVQGLEQIIDDVQSTLEIGTVKWNDEGEETSSNTGIAIAAGFLFTFMIYMFVMSYGGMVMQSVMEEKTNRIVELMVSSVKPFQLMMGKIVGVALVGFVQLLIWGVMLAVILSACSVAFGWDMAAMSEAQGAMMTGAQAGMPAMDTADAEMLAALLNLPFAELGIMFVLYFVGGYLLYDSFFAAVGASINAQEDSSQFIMPVVLIMVFGLYAAMYSVENTDGPLAFWASMFPLTSPIVMMVRIPFDVPLWQELLSLGLLYGTALLFVWVGARIYRVGILMYGKKPSLREMLKWLRYK